MAEPARRAKTGSASPPGEAATNARAILWMLLGAACIVAMSAVLKHVSMDLPVAVVFFFRMLFAIPLVLPWVARDGIGMLRTQRLGSHIVRGIVGALSMWCWVYGVKYLPLTTFTAISFTRPLWMTLTAWIMLREVVGRRRGLLTLVGFAGVVLVVRPAFDAELAVLVALLGGAVSSLTLVQVKQLAATEPAARIVFYFSLFGTLIALPFALWDWTMPSVPQLGWLALAAIAAAATQYCVARAAALGDATLITPIDFIQIPFAAIVGFVLFSELPDLLTFAGSAVIVAAVLAMVHADRRRRPDPRLP